MKTIADLTTAVNNLVTVENEVVTALGNATPPTGTVLTADDQAALDNAVATVQSVADTLTAALPQPAPAPAAEPAPASEPPADGTAPTA